MKKLLAILLAVTLIASFTAVFASAEEGKYDLVKNSIAGPDNGDTIEPGAWNGYLSLAGAAVPVATTRIINEQGYLECKLDSDMGGIVDQAFGNYIGVSDVVKPNTTYKLTLEIMLDVNLDHDIQKDATLGSYYKQIYAFYADSHDNLAPEHMLTITDTAGEFVTVETTFTTGASVPETAKIQVGAGLVGIGYLHFAGVAPGFHMILKSCTLEGDLLKVDTPETESTAAPTDAPTQSGTDESGDNSDTGYNVVAVAVIAVAAVSAIVVSKKRKND